MSRSAPGSLLGSAGEVFEGEAFGADADVVSWRWTAYDIENGGVDLAGVDSGVAPPGSDPAVVVGGLVDDC